MTQRKYSGDSNSNNFNPLGSKTFNPDYYTAIESKKVSKILLLLFFALLITPLFIQA